MDHLVGQGLLLIELDVQDTPRDGPTHKRPERSAAHMGPDVLSQSKHPPPNRCGRPALFGFFASPFWFFRPPFLVFSSALFDFFGASLP